MPETSRLYTKVSVVAPHRPRDLDKVVAQTGSPTEHILTAETEPCVVIQQKLGKIATISVFGPMVFRSADTRQLQQLSQTVQRIANNTEPFFVASIPDSQTILHGSILSPTIAYQINDPEGNLEGIHNALLECVTIEGQGGFYQTQNTGANYQPFVVQKKRGKPAMSAHITELWTIETCRAGVVGKERKRPPAAPLVKRYPLRGVESPLVDDHL